MKRSIVLLGAAMPVALAIGLATVAVGPAPAAQATDNCHNPGEWYDLQTTISGYPAAQYWDATGGATGDRVNDELVINSVTVDPTTWCQVVGAADGVGGNYVMYRAKDTSECATYAGPAKGTSAGVGYVDLQPCDSSLEAQNFWTTQITNGWVLNTEYQVNNGQGGSPGYTCLSADKLWADGSGATTNLVMVNSDSCGGAGGQAWNFTGVVQYIEQ